VENYQKQDFPTKKRNVHKYSLLREVVWIATCLSLYFVRSEFCCWSAI